jgi:hypothetical protein
MYRARGVEVEFKLHKNNAARLRGPCAGPRTPHRFLKLSLSVFRICSNSALRIIAAEFGLPLKPRQFLKAGRNFMNALIDHCTTQFKFIP